MAIQRRAHGAATTFATSQSFPYSLSAAQGDTCYLITANTAPIDATISGWTSKGTANGGGYYVRVFRRDASYPASAPTQPTANSTGGAGGVGWIEHWYTDTAGWSLEDDLQFGTDADNTSTTFSASGPSMTELANDVLASMIFLKTVSTMTASPPGPTLNQTGITLGTQVGDLGGRLTIASPTNSLFYGGYHRPVSTNGSGVPTISTTSGTGGGNATGLAAFLRLREVAPANVKPTANAGSNQTISSGQTNIPLSGSGSTDSDGTVASYAWTQTSGPAVTLSGTGANRTYTAPTGPATLVFQLVVTDNLGLASDPATVTHTVNAPVTIPSGGGQYVGYNRRAYQNGVWS